MDKIIKLDNSVVDAVYATVDAFALMNGVDFDLQLCRDRKEDAVAQQDFVLAEFYRDCADDLRWLRGKLIVFVT